MEKEGMTRKTALAFGIGAGLILAGGTASADCLTEVQALQEQLNTADRPNARTGPSDPGVQQPDPSAPIDTSGISQQQSITTAPTDMSGTGETTTGMNTDPDDGSSVDIPEREGNNATIGPSDPGVQQPQNEDMDVTQRDPSSSTTTTTMPSDTVGAGTVTETTRSGQLATPPDSRSVALTSLKRAQLYADAGQEEACMTELNTARQHLGVQ
jgi:hypothetical protein